MQIVKPTSVNPADYRAAIGHFVTGVTVVTSAGERGPTGMTVNSLTSVSLDPCQLLVCLKRASVTGRSIRESGKFAVCLLNDQQKDIAMRFAKPASERFEGIPHRLDGSGVPIIDGSLASIVCDVEAIHASGDHDIYIGMVRSCTSAGSDPLVFFKGSFDLVGAVQKQERIARSAGCRTGL